MSDYSLMIDETPPSINKFSGFRGGYAKRAAIVRFGWLIKAAMAEYGVPPATGKRRILTTIVFTTKRRRDRANYCKIWDDAMVEAVLLVDDCPEWYDDALPKLQVGEKSCTMVEIWEVGDADEG